MMCADRSIHLQVEFQVVARKGDLFVWAQMPEKCLPPQQLYTVILKPDSHGPFHVSGAAPAGGGGAN